MSMNHTEYFNQQDTLNIWFKITEKLSFQKADLQNVIFLHDHIFRLNMFTPKGG